jgi:hypothetical protein
MHESERSRTNEGAPVVIWLFAHYIGAKSGAANIAGLADELFLPAAMQ